MEHNAEPGSRKPDIVSPSVLCLPCTKLLLELFATLHAKHKCPGNESPKLSQAVLREWVEKLVLCI